MRRMRLHVSDVVHLLGDNLSDLPHAGERPSCRAAQPGRGAGDELERMQWSCSRRCATA
jgi:hypothetical protein